MILSQHTVEIMQDDPIEKLAREMCEAFKEFQTPKPVAATIFLGDQVVANGVAWRGSEPYPQWCFRPTPESSPSILPERGTTLKLSDREAILRLQRLWLCSAGPEHHYHFEIEE
jgi:hypothetical protein